MNVSAARRRLAGPRRSAGENAYRDVNIAFANELSMISDRMGLDVWEVIRLANRHPRVNILQPGPGVGGHCIAVDPQSLLAFPLRSQAMLCVAALAVVLLARSPVAATAREGEAR